MVWFLKIFGGANKEIIVLHAPGGARPCWGRSLGKSSAYGKSMAYSRGKSFGESVGMSCINDIEGNDDCLSVAERHEMKSKLIRFSVCELASSRTV